MNGPTDIADLKFRADQCEARARAGRDPYDNRQGAAAARAQDAAQEAVYLRARIKAMEAKRCGDLQAIHAEARRRGIDDETRRAMIERISEGRTRTSGELTAMEREVLLRELGADKNRFPRRAGRGPKPQAMDRQTMLKKVGAMLADAKLPWAYAEAILRKQRGIGDKAIACRIEAATDPELRGVIAALYRRSKPDAPRR